MRSLRKLIAALALLSVAVAFPLSADDTEIYFGGIGDPNSVVRPNILFVLDTSSSMTNTDGGSTTRLDRMKEALHTILDETSNVNVGLMRFHRIGGPVLYPISNIDGDATATADTTIVRVSGGSDDAEQDSTGVVITDSDRLEKGDLPPGAESTVLIPVASGDDDAEEVATGGNTGSVNLASTDLELPREGNVQQIIGIRFAGVNVPPGATITSAQLEFEIDETKGGNENNSVDLIIEGQAADDAPAFEATANNISSRTRTTASVAWADVANPAVGEPLVSADVSSIVSELVDPTTGWLEGNAMAFIISKTSGNGNRTVGSYEDPDTTEPKLRITYLEGTSGPQTVGVRFQGVDIPQGAVITSAVVEFTAGAVDSGSTDLHIHGIAEDNAAAFAGTDNEISALSETTASADWNSSSTPTLDAWTATDVVHQTPDLTGIVQEIVNRSGWCGGNAMAFKVEANAGSVGKRSSYSYEGDASKAPLLRVTWDNTTPPDGATGCINKTFTAQVATSVDDAEERTDGSMYLTSTDLELTEDGGATQTIGIRFRNVQIPQGATVLGADLTFTVDEATSGTTELSIYSEAADDAAAYSDTAYDISGRERSLTFVDWRDTSTPPLDAWTTVGDKKTTPDLTSIVQEVISRGGWAPGNAMAFIITGLGSRVAEAYDKSGGVPPRLRIRYQETGVTTVATTVRSAMKGVIDELQYKSGTPILSTLVEGAFYYRGDRVLYGLRRGDQGTRSEFTRVSHPDSWGGTQDDVTRSGNCTEFNPNNLDCVTEIVDPDNDGDFTTNPPSYVSPITESCQANYIVLLSDGLGFISDVETGTWEPTQYVHDIVGSSACTGHDDCAKALVRNLRNEDQNALDGDQTIRTYTIGFNLGDTNPTFLQELATEGGGAFYAADSAADLSKVFQNIIADALSAPTSFTAPSLSVNAFNRLFNRSDVFFALFQPNENKRWVGNIKKFSICAGNPDDSCQLGEVIDATGAPAIGTDSRIKGSARSYWSTTNDGPTVNEGGSGEKAQSQGYGDRNVYTYTGADFFPATPVSLNTDAHKVLDSNTDLTKTLLGDSLMSDGARTEVINWIRGQDVKDEDGDGSDTDTRWVYADPLHSRPLSITYGAPYCQAADISSASPGDACYGGIANSTRNADQAVIKLVVGTNDGVLHFINEYNGREEWAFVPPELLDEQQALMNNTAGDHIYGIDGTPSALIIDNNKNGVIEPSESDKVYLFVGLRRGGNSIYAFDITPTTSALDDPTATDPVQPKFMWRIKGGEGEFGSLGQTWSRPTPMSIRYGNGSGGSEPRDVLVFGGGYDTGQDAVTASLTTEDGDAVYHGTDGVGNAIYIVNPVTGARIWWASDTGSGAELELPHMDYSIPSDIAGLDSDGDGEEDRLYFSDVGGQVWRIDLGDTLRSGNNGGSTGGRLADFGYPLLGESAKRKFFYPPDIAQVRETQVSFQAFSDYDLVTIASGNRAHPLDIDVHNRLYALRDYLTESRIVMDGTTKEPTNYPVCITSSSVSAPCGGPLTEANLVDTTDNLIQEGNALQVATKETEFKLGEGWLINLQELDGSWIGEKGLARTLILDGILFASTFVPTETGDPCQGAEGSGRLYAVSVYTGEAIFDWNSSGSITRADRSLQLGGGVPSEVVPVFQEQGVTLLIGTGAGASRVDPNIGLPRDVTFWYQEY